MRWSSSRASSSRFSASRGQPQRVGVHVPGGLGPVQAVRVVQRHLELGADAGDRAAQLVRGVGHQVALALLRVGQPGEHVVQRDRERAHLVPGLRHRQVARDPGLGHLGRAAAQPGDGPQRVPGDQPDGQGHQAEQQRRPDEHGLGHGGDAVAGLGEGDRGHHHLAVVRADRHHAQRRRHAQRRPGQHAPLAGPGRGPGLRRRQQRHQPVRALRHVGDPALGVEHLDGDRAGPHRHRVGQPVLVDQRRHLRRALPGRVVQPADQGQPQRVDQQQRGGGQGQGQPGRGDQGQPGPQAAAPPPPSHGQPPSAASR